MYSFQQDLRFAFRQLRKAPGFTVTVVLTLALGIGATTAIFSLVEGILLRPLPFRDSARLVRLGDRLSQGLGTSVTAREIAIYAGASNAFASVGGYMTTNYELSGGAVPEEISAARSTAGVLTTLAVQPLLGRVFTQQEEDSRQPLAVISYALWLERFHRDPAVLGQSLVLDRRTYSILGVMPRDFEFPLQPGRVDQTQVWLPLSMTPEELSDTNAGHFGYQLVARMKDGVTVSQAAQDADRVAQIAKSNFPPTMSALHIHGDVTPLLEDAVGDVRPVLRALLIAVVFVLLLACVNVAGLQLVRAIRRRREYALRLALGAGSRTIIRESIFESLLLSLPGGLLGLALAAVIIRTALHLLPDSMPRVSSIAMDAKVVVFALLLAVATGILCSLAPAFAALRTSPTQGLKEGAATGSGSSSHTWLRSGLVVSEIAVALMLLTVSGAFLRSFQKMRSVDPGFRSDHVLIAEYQLPLNQYPNNTSVDLFHRTVLDRLAAKPGIATVGLTDALPSSGSIREASYTLEGVAAENWKIQFAMLPTTDGDYFHALGIPLLEGRLFTPEDRENAPLVAIMSQSMAKHSWPGQSALGKRIHIGNPKKDLPWATVVGVVGDANFGPRDEPGVDEFYAPATQPALFPIRESGKLSNPAGGCVIVRSTLPPEQITQSVRSAIAEVDPLLALQHVQPMDSVMASVESPRRFNTDLICAFGLAALLLAVTGIYAVVAFSVSLRTQEIAIRMALGAQRMRIAQLVLGSGARLALLGCVLGVLGSLGVSRLVRSFLFEVSPTDPLIYIEGVLIMLCLALVASALPASRASAADPVKALRAT
jgi:putative ABC transport system permease protein